ncbi:cytochrome P450 [Crepidotus variabilis]|uniref:Cytochrome P450 n=1 Tax=Crepidotus variabilis TaxID=179855 RepID=A0A9P6JV21_9AGAR|nr:cytochrome P450 [Crepidotus variabilis]
MTFDSYSVFRVGGAFLALFALLKLVHKLYQDWTSPMNMLQGPKRQNWLFGNMKQAWDDDTLSTLDKWFAQYGSVIQAHGVMGERYLMTIDPKALNRVLTNTNVYGKSEGTRYNLSQILGEGVLVTEGDKHRQQRRVMNPAFGAPQVRELTEIFVNKSNLLRDLLMDEVKDSKDKNVNIAPWLNKMTLDVIGLAGFHYKFDALTSDAEKNELNVAFSRLFSLSTTGSFLTIARSLFPIFRLLPMKRDIDSKVSRNAMARIGKKLLSDSRAAVLAENSTVEKSTWKGKDLLSLLMKANMASDLAPDLRMSDEDVLAQVPTFLVAGHETTATATMWALFALTQAPEVQKKLRAELLSVSTDTPSMDELSELPYLDAVVREVLRLHAPVPGTMRQAMEDDILPLSKPFVDKYGKTHDSLFVRKGTRVRVPILAINRTETIWGPDAKEFKPERWLDSSVPQAAHAIPGVWGHMLTFLGGPRACIGYRFSIVELKALLFALVPAFEFELGVPPEEIIKKALIVQRPVVKSEKSKGNQLPLKIRPVQMDKY